MCINALVDASYILLDPRLKRGESIMAEFIQKHKLFSFYSALMIVVVLIAIFAPWLAPGDAFSSNLSQALQAPSSQHWLVQISLVAMYCLASLWYTVILVYGCQYRCYHG